MKPLVVSFDHGFFREQHLKNVERTLKILGTDFLVFKPNMQIVGKLMLKVLKKKRRFLLALSHRSICLSNANSCEI